MSIQEISSNFKRLLSGEDVRLVFIILLVGVISFLFGRMSVAPEIPSTVTHSPATVVDTVGGSPQVVTVGVAPEITREESPEAGKTTSVTNDAGGYVASKNGTKYHLPWCSGAKRIKEENKVWFKTKAEAEAAGYTPAANCKGI